MCSKIRLILSGFWVYEAFFFITGINGIILGVLRGWA